MKGENKMADDNKLLDGGSDVNVNINTTQPNNNREPKGGYMNNNGSNNNNTALTVLLTILVIVGIIGLLMGAYALMKCNKPVIVGQQNATTNNPTGNVVGIISAPTTGRPICSAYAIGAPTTTGGTCKFCTVNYTKPGTVDVYGNVEGQYGPGAWVYQYANQDEQSFAQCISGQDFVYDSAYTPVWHLSGGYTPAIQQPVVQQQPVIPTAVAPAPVVDESKCHAVAIGTPVSISGTCQNCTIDTARSVVVATTAQSYKPGDYVFQYDQTMTQDEFMQCIMAQSFVSDPSYSYTVK